MNDHDDFVAFVAMGLLGLILFFLCYSAIKERDTRAACIAAGYAGYLEAQGGPYCMTITNGQRIIIPASQVRS